MREDYTLLTPENVELRYDVAGAGSRLAAAAIDYAILVVAYIVIAVGGTFAIGFVTAFLRDVLRGDAGAVIPGGPSLYRFLGVAFLILVTFFLWWGYFVLFEMLWNGQSPGKRMLGLRVVRVGGQPVSLGSSLIRNLLRIVDVTLPIGVIVMLIDRESRRLGDFAAGTLVVREPSRSGLEPAVATGASEAPSISDEPALAFPSADRLTAAHYALLREYFARRPKLRRDAADRLATRLAADLARALSVPEPPSSEGAAFLATALRAYELRHQYQE